MVQNCSFFYKMFFQKNILKGNHMWSMFVKIVFVSSWNKAKNCYWNYCQRNCFVPCITDQATLDQLTIPVNELSWSEHRSNTKYIAEKLFVWANCPNSLSCSGPPQPWEHFVQKQYSRGLDRNWNPGGLL